MLSQIGSSAILESSPGCFSQDSFFISLSNFSVMEEPKRCAVKFENLFNSLLLDNIFNVSKCFSKQIQIMLGVIFFLQVISDSSKVS